MRLIVTGSLAASEEDIRAIEALGHSVVLHPDERIPVEAPEQFEGIIGNSVFYYQGYEQFSSVRYLQITITEEELLLKANQWELRGGGTTGRSAQQFINFLAGSAVEE